MTEISDTELDEITWANSDEGNAAFGAAWNKARALSLYSRPATAADVGALVWAAHQATAGSEENAETEDFPAHLHSWSVLGAQEVPPIMAFMTKPIPRTAVLTRCTTCGEPATRVLEGTWTLDTFAATPADGA